MTPEEKYMEIANGLTDAKQGKMFGALCLKAANGKALAMFYKDHMVFKLDGEAYDEAMSLDGASLFDPMGGRPMKAWVQVPFDYAAQWEGFMRSALEFVREL